MNATPETEKMSAGQALKIAQQFVDAEIGVPQAQAIAGSGVIKLLCHADMEKYDSWKVAHALGLCEPRRVTIPDRAELLAITLKAARARRLSCAKVPDSFFGNRRYDLEVALFPFGRHERQEGVAQLVARLTAIGYAAPKFHEMVAFALSTDREQLFRSWPLVLRGNFVAVGSLEKLFGNFDFGDVSGKTGFANIVFRNEEKVVSIYPSLPDWENSFILGVKSA